VTSQKYHFIVHAAPPETKGLDSTGVPMPRGCKQCTYCGRPVQNACKRCPLCQGDLTRLPSQVRCAVSKPRSLELMKQPGKNISTRSTLSVLLGGRAYGVCFGKRCVHVWVSPALEVM